MAIFGVLPKKLPFGTIPGMGSPTGGGLMPGAMQPNMGAMTKKPGFFSGINIGDVLGAFGDAFSENGPVYAQGKQRQNELMQRQQMAEQERMQRREDMQWEWQNKPKDANPYRWESNDGSLMGLGPDGQPVQIYKDPTPKMQWVPDGFGGGQMIPVTGAVSNGLPEIGSVIPDPRKRGGPASQAPGGFRPRGY